MASIVGKNARAVLERLQLESEIPKIAKRSKRRKKRLSRNGTKTKKAVFVLASDSVKIADICPNTGIPIIRNR